MEELKKYLPVYLRICRSVALYFSFLAAFGIAYLSSGLVAVAGVILLPLIFHSTARVFGETDRALTDIALAYREERNTHQRVPREILALILTSKDHLLELGILLFLPILLPLELGYGPLVTLLFGAGTVPRALKKLLTLAIVLPVFFGLWLLARYYAFLWLAYRENKMEIHFLRDLILKLLGNAAIYAIGSLGIMAVLGAIITFYFVLEAFFLFCWWLPLLLIAFFLSFRFLRACRIRRKFLRRLKKLCRELGATLSQIKRPYRSLLRLRDEVNFTLQYGEKTYHCKLFCALKRHTPLFFSEKGIVQCLHSFRFRRVEYFRYTSQFDFSFEGQGHKILIVNPVPKEIYAGDTSFYREIDTGERVGTYTVFTATGFLGALSRDVLSR